VPTAVDENHGSMDPGARSRLSLMMQKTDAAR